MKETAGVALKAGRSLFVVGMDAAARAAEVSRIVAAMPGGVLIDPNHLVPATPDAVHRRPVDHGVLTTFRAVLRMAPGCVVIPEVSEELFDAIFTAVETGTQIVTSFEAAGPDEGQAWFEAQAADRAGVPVDVVRESLRRRPPLYLVATKDR